MKVLIVEDEAAMSLWESEGADLVVLDLMLPKLNGVEVCWRICVHSAVPVIMLTTKGSEDDVVARGLSRPVVRAAKRARYRARHCQGGGRDPWRDDRGRQPAWGGQLLHGDAAAGIRKASITID